MAIFMHLPTEDKLAEVLRLINEIRVALTRSPLEAIPKGKKGDAAECPIAVALSNGWEVDVGDIEISFYPPTAMPMYELEEYRTWPQAL